MANIKSGYSTAIWLIEEESKAGRVLPVGIDGSPLGYRADKTRGLAKIHVRQTAATAAGANVWVFRSKTSARVQYIRRVWWQLSFDGTGAATQMAYAWRKGFTCTAITNGSYVIPAVKRTSLVSTDLEIKTLDTGLTLTGVSWDADIDRSTWSRLTPSATQAGVISPRFELNFADQPLELAQDEVFALYSLNNSVIGDTVTGGIDFCGG